MMQVSIIIPQACSLESSIVRLCRIFDCANAGSANAEDRQGPDALFSVSLAGVTGHITLYGNRLVVKPHYTFTDGGENDLVIIPALAGNIGDALTNNQELVPWLIEQYRRGAVIAGCCTGAFLLSDAQLVNDASCNKTWYVAPDFRKEFAQVNDAAEKLVPDEKSIATENGAYTFINRLLHKTAGAATAASCADLFEAEFNRECQSVFCISHKDPLPKNVWQRSLSSNPWHDRFYSTDNVYAGNTASVGANAVALKRVFRKAQENKK
jgi:transcriptional regulator GlxA family with amidase domain